MSKQTLRELAKDYAKGTIGKDKYRKLRAELINAIVTNEVAVIDIDYDPPLLPPNNSDSDDDDAITEGIIRNKAETATPQQSPKPTSIPAEKQNITAKKNNEKSPFIFILVSAIIVLSLIIAVALFYPKPPASESVNKPGTSNNSMNSSEVAATISNENIAGESLIAEFLSEKNWNEDSLSTFIESWSALTQEERDSAKQTKRMQRMKDSIYKKFLEGKALASIDSEKSLTKQQKLIEFASAIGIDDSRLTLD